MNLNIKKTTIMLLLSIFLIPFSLIGQTQKINGIIYDYDKSSKEVYVKGVTNRKIEKAVILDSIQIKNKYLKVQRIGNYAFKGCNLLKEITIPNSVIQINNGVFEGCSSLHNIQIPNSVKIIQNFTFEGCSSLQTVVMPNLINKINASLFKNCTSLTSVNIPNSVTVIESEAFSGCSSLANITIPESVVTIEFMAFYKCSSLTNVIIPESVTSIGFSAFSGCSSLTNITIPNSVKSIGSGAFSGCNSLTDIDIPNSITVIGNHTFMSCESLTSVTIPNSVKTIGKSVFAHCKSLKSVIIPNSVDSIGKGAFSWCPALESVILPNKWPKIDKSVFEYSKNIAYVSDIEGNVPYYADSYIPEDSPWGLNFSKQSAEIYQSKADLGDAEAQYNLGEYYKRGRGVERDIKQAIYWLTKSANQGYSPAQFSLGLIYQYGSGVEKNLEQAAYWYIKAEEQGSTIARQCLVELKVAPYYQKTDGWAIATAILQGLSDGVNTYNQITNSQKQPVATPNNTINQPQQNKNNDVPSYSVNDCNKRQKNYNEDGEQVKYWMSRYKDQWVTYYKDKAAGKTGSLYNINVTDQFKQIQHYQSRMREHRKICPSISQSELETITPKTYIKKTWGIDVDY